jgi:hypothetical protein
MNELDRWVNLEGPEPPWIRDLLDASGEEVPELSLEDEERMKRDILRALDERDRQVARRHRAKVALVWGVAVAGAVAAVATAMWVMAPIRIGIGKGASQNAIGAMGEAEATGDGGSQASGASAGPRRVMPAMKGERGRLR